MTSPSTTLDLTKFSNHDGPVLVHADLMKARYFVPAFANRDQLLQTHLKTIRSAIAPRPVWFACFNYDFTRTGRYDAANAECQVGPLGEFSRKQPGYWRSDDPVFSLCTSDGKWNRSHDTEAAGVKANRQMVEAFGPDCGLARLYERNGLALFYGASFSSATIIHYAESRSGGPVYRYDKDFVGTVTGIDGVSKELIYRYHVRPMGMAMEYDWDRLQSELVENGILEVQTHRSKSVALVASVREIVDFWVDRLSKDPLHLLDSSTREKIVALGLKPGERVRRIDFESQRAA